MSRKKLHLLGYASAVGGVDPHCAEGPLAIRNSPFLSKLTAAGLDYQWDYIIYPQSIGPTYEIVQHACEELANKIAALVRAQELFSVIGGDHTCAIGTWSGVYDALHAQGEIGLIWIDAHMDSHTPTTSLSGRIHGMPLATLLGHGPSSLTHILHARAKLQAEHVCIIGARSFEAGEVALLQKLNVRIFYMDEVQQRGFTTILQEAVHLVSQNTVAYGLSLDLDSINPSDAPGVDVPEPNGISAAEMQIGLATLATDPKLIGWEIVEFDPARDQQQRTEKLVIDLLIALAQNKKSFAHEKK